MGRRLLLLGTAPRAPLDKKGSWLLHQIDDKSSPAARDSSEVAHTFNGRCYPHTGNGGHSWFCLSIAPRAQLLK